MSGLSNTSSACMRSFISCQHDTTKAHTDHLGVRKMVCTCHSKLSVRIPNMKGVGHSRCLPRGMPAHNRSYIVRTVSVPLENFTSICFALYKYNCVYMNIQGRTQVPSLWLMAHGDHQYCEDSLPKRVSGQVGWAVHAPLHLADLADAPVIPWEQCLLKSWRMALTGCFT